MLLPIRMTLLGAAGYSDSATHPRKYHANVGTMMRR